MEGFLPRKGQERKQRLAEIAVEERTTVLFESPKRVGATVADLLELCGPDRPMAIVRESHQTPRRSISWVAPRGQRLGQ